MKKLLILLLVLNGYITIAQNSSVIINSVQIFNGKEELTIVGNVLITDNFVTKISKVPIMTNKSFKTKIIDGKDKFLMPSLIDNHMHLIMCGSTEAELLALGVYVMKEPNLHYHLYTGEPKVKDRDERGLLKAYTESVESMLEKYPIQWFNYFYFCNQLQNNRRN